MNKYMSVFILCLIFSCSNENNISKTPSNGFINGVDAKFMMGSESAVEIFNKIDKAWSDLDYDVLKTFIAEDAEMKFADGNFAIGPDQFIERIKEWVKEVEEADGNEYTWTTDYAFALALTEGEGDWVNAQFTSTHTNPDSKLSAEVFYEFYHIVDGKVQEWNQFKRDVPR
tara:strand:+ start:9976 stop:10488 length:513 start_codon:yes stop_codon:yes gene_type:complete